jgi:hypothetical protein
MPKYLEIGLRLESAVLGSFPDLGVGVKVSIALPAGISGGTSIVSLWLEGISTVCVMLIKQIYGLSGRLSREQHEKTNIRRKT